jgi:hypothetical protein
MLDTFTNPDNINVHRLQTETPEKEWNPEIELNLREQYNVQLNILRNNHLLETLSSGQEGITTILNQEVPLPTYEQIRSSLESNQELYQTKASQGFKRLIIVPFGKKLQDLIDAYADGLKRHAQEGKLFYPKLNSSDPDKPTQLDQNQPIWVWDKYNNADTAGSLIYHPTSFTPENHGGKTKAEILSEPPTPPDSSVGRGTTSAWTVLLLEERLDIPRSGQGQTLGAPGHDRPQLEAGQSPNDYLTLLQQAQQNPKDPYYREQGLTLEDWLVLALANLEEKNQVTDDYQGQGSISYHLGAFFPAADDVPGAYWRQDDRRAYLSGDGPEGQDGGFGVRSAVRANILDTRSSTSLSDLHPSTPPMPVTRNF